MRYRTSPIWIISDDEFKNRVKNSATMSELLRTFGLENKGNNFLTCKKRITELHIDSSHFLNWTQSSLLTRTMTLENFLNIIENDKKIDRNRVKKYILRFSLIDYKCSECGILPLWKNKKLSLHLEHKDGNPINNKLSNLCFLCPNCHSQTDTYAGKSLKKIWKCILCDEERSKSSARKFCMNCATKNRKTAERVTEEELINLLKQKPLIQIAKDFGFKTGNSIKKWCIFYGINSKDISPFSRKNRKIQID